MADFSSLLMFTCRDLGRFLTPSPGASPRDHQLLGFLGGPRWACLRSFVSVFHRDVVAFDLLVDQDAQNAEKPPGARLAENFDFQRQVRDLH
jgi:hypothetical protein